MSSLPSSPKYTYIYTLLGTGASTGTPMIYECLRTPSLVLTDVEKRHNPSMLLQIMNNELTIVVYQLIIDMGKTFRFSIYDQIRRLELDKLEGEKKYGYHAIEPNFNGIIITHPHADAILGLDDSRELIDKLRLTSYLPLYSNESCINYVMKVFSYLFDTQPINNKDIKPCCNEKECNNNVPIKTTWVGKLKPEIITPFTPINLPLPEDLIDVFNIIPIPLHHGNSMLGYIMQSSNSQVVYFSDHCNPCFSRNVIDSASPDSFSREYFETYEPHSDYLGFLIDVESTLPILKKLPIKSLILDSLHPAHPHPTHSSFYESEQIIVELERNGVDLSNTEIYCVGQSSKITKCWYNSLNPKSRINWTEDGIQFHHN